MIILEELGKKFTQDYVVSDINLKIAPGEIIGLLGPNGAGKTTTLRMLAGVLPPSKGRIIINGEEMENAQHNLKRQIGFLPENNPLYNDLTVEEYLKFWAEVKGLNKHQVKEAIKFVVGKTSINSVFYRPIAELSKGFRQRVGLSQALLAKPNILLLDEPTEGLDPNQRSEIKDLILGLGKSRTVIISSHVLSEVARICNRVIIIHKGKVVADGSPESLRHKDKGSIVIETEITGKRISESLKKINGVLSVTKNSGFYEVVCTKDIREQIFQTAVKSKWLLKTLYKKEVELEDVFSQLTKN